MYGIEVIGLELKIPLFSSLGKGYIPDLSWLF